MRTDSEGPEEMSDDERRQHVKHAVGLEDDE